MISFHTRFPELAARETRSLHVLAPGGILPVGEYGFLEHYCTDRACDCRRVLLCVTSAKPPHPVLATINFGWESPEFYTGWMHGDARAGRDITAASLDPLHPQSPYADHLLDYFQTRMLTDPAYVTRLARHYELFKNAQAAMTNDSTSSVPETGMTPDEILRQLRHVPGKCDFAPYEAALRAAVVHQEALVPQLIASLDRVSADPARYREHQEDCLFMFAVYLLAQFRETRARDAFLRFFSLPGEDALDLTGDLVTENGAAVLASVCGGDPAPLLRLARDESVNEFIRQQAIDGLAVQCGWGERPREAVIADLRNLFDTLPRPGDAYLWAALVCTVSDFEATELLPEVRRAFAEELVDDNVIGLKDIDPEIPRGPERFPWRGGEARYQRFMERNAPIDAVNECAVWLCFRDEDEDADDWNDPGFGEEEGDEDLVNSIMDGPLIDLPPAPYVAPPKVGRNDPCPCGSGRKFKKCCGK